MKPKFYSLGGSFVIENYNWAAPFSSFFPAVAGETGRPLWLFYANRGQAVASFGINNKDGAMLEFSPANKAYQSLPLLGFRTFIKTSQNKDWFEPFHVHQSSFQKMIIRPHELEIHDANPDLKIETSVIYFGVPHENHPVLARSLSIKNSSDKTVQVTLVDGLPRVVPFGMTDFLVKNMSRTIEAFTEVLNVERHVPIFKLKIEPSDRPELQHLNSGFFSFALFNGNFLPVITDPSVL